MSETADPGTAFYLECRPPVGCGDRIESSFVLRDRDRIARLTRTEIASHLTTVRILHDERAPEPGPRLSIRPPDASARPRAAPAHGWVFGVRLRGPVDPAALAAALRVSEPMRARQRAAMTGAPVLETVLAAADATALAVDAALAASAQGAGAPGPAQASERTQRRRFKAATGLTPKQHQMLTRFHAALAGLRNGACRLSDVAHDADYADQAHFARDFRRKAGRTPSSFLAAWSGGPVRFFQDGELGPSVRFGMLIA